MARRALVTDPARQVLVFAAEHRLVLADHVQLLLQVSERTAHDQLAELEAAGLLKHHQLMAAQPSCYQITRAGLAAIDNEDPPLPLDVRHYRRDLGAAWLWLAAIDGAFGEIEYVMSKRELQSHDETWAANTHRVDGGDPQPPLPDRSMPPFGVPIAGTGPDEPSRRPHPDLMLIAERGRVPVELALSSTGPRLEEILTAYAAEPKIAAVMYLVDDPALSRTVQSVTARLGLSRLVYVQRATSTRPESVGNRDAARR